jgi:general secretion pathway protein A
MRQLAQRVTARYNLQALLAGESRAYIVHRCQVAGAQAPLFSKLALFRAHRLTGGVPRLINVLCDRALLTAYARGKTRVNVGILRAAAREVETGVRTRPTWRFTAIALAAVLVTTVSVFAVWQLKPELLVRFTGANPAAAVPPAETADASASPAVINSALPATMHTPTLDQVLADPNIPTDTDSAFTALFTQWGLDYARFSGATGCERAQAAGLRCLFESGTWSNLRQLNRPAIVELVDGAGTRHHVLAVRLTAESVTLQVSAQRREFAQSEVDRVWFGKYLVLWSPPEFGERTIRRGMRGVPVVWLRDALTRAGFVRASAAVSDVFDGEIETVVREFQRRHQLQDDGIVGALTLVHLSNYAGNTSAPVLSAVPQTEIR